MKKLEIYGLKLEEEINPTTDLAELIVRKAQEQANGIEEGDVIVITSKIVSKVEGGIYKLSEVEPSKRARVLSKIYRKKPEVVELILRNSDGIEFVIPMKKLARKYAHVFKCYTTDEEIAKKLLEEDPYIFMCKVGGLLLTDAGLDFSNSPPGYCTLPPKDPDRSAREIRARIKELTGKDTAVVITDTEWKIDKFGTVDIAIGCSGIQPISRKFGSKDLYGKPKFGGVDDLSNLVSASANLLFGQTDEAIPVAIIRGLKYEKSEDGVRSISYFRQAYKGAFRMLLWENIKFKLISKLLKVIKGPK